MTSQFYILSYVIFGRFLLFETSVQSIDDTNLFCIVLFKYLHKNEIMVDDWDPLLVRDLTKRLMGNEDSIMPLIQILHQ